MAVDEDDGLCGNFPLLDVGATWGTGIRVKIPRGIA